MREELSRSERIRELALLAVAARSQARVIKSDGTWVGAAARDARTGTIATGCNVEHRFRCHDVHAEVNALSTLRTLVGQRLLVEMVVVVARREQFSPCGGCLDWIWELGGPGTIVAFVPYTAMSRLDFAQQQVWAAAELMPHYPR